MPCAIRRLLLAQIVFTALAALGAIGWSLAQERKELIGAAEVQRLNHVGGLLIEAVLRTGVERGLTVIALAAPASLREHDFAGIRERRGQSEQLYRKIMERMQGDFRDEASRFAASLHGLQRSHERLERARIRVGESLKGGLRTITPGEWFETATGYNNALGGLQDALCALPKIAQAPLAGCLAVKDQIFWIGEHAGRIRAIIGRAIAAERPLRRDEQYQLFHYRADVARRLEQLDGILSWFPEDPDLAEAMARSREQFARNYKPLFLAAFEAGSTAQTYPVDTATWFARTSEGIDSLRGLVEALSSAIDRAIAGEVAARTHNVTTLAALMFLLLAGLTVLTIQVYRRLFSRLSMLQAAADRIGHGDLEHPVSLDFRDELTALGGAFETMRLNLLADIARRRETEARLRRANEELQRFTSVVSHDLKAPLRAVHGLSTFIEEEVDRNLSEEGRARMRLLRDRVQRMDDLINALLDYSRAGERTAPLEEVDTGALVHDVIRSREVPEGFEISTAPDLPRFTTDRLHLEQVFANLIGNAVEHHGSPVGRIEVTCRDLGNAFEFAVSDDGPGIPPAYHGQMFEMFQRVGEPIHAAGTGIGLAVVKKVVERMGGNIGVTSTPGAGATFRFTWPKDLAGEA